MSSSSVPHRICGYVCVGLLVAIATVQFSLFTGAVSFCILAIATLLRSHIRSMAKRFYVWMTSIYERGKKWSGCDNWIEVFLLHCLALAAGMGAWAIWLTYLGWPTKDITVAALVIALSVAMPTCIARRTEKRSDGHQNGFDRLCFALGGAGAIALIALWVLSCPLFR
jgi:hypothetical protein